MWISPEVVLEALPFVAPEGTRSGLTSSDMARGAPNESGAFCAGSAHTEPWAGVDDRHASASPLAAPPLRDGDIILADT